ncbi:MAG: mechanosensitive ion channel, partial [Candidatus Omnitrophica bacterium]|nr:mechanosensitive ion channel [Candidatus Omnitrophota bacterium]
MRIIKSLYQKVLLFLSALLMPIMALAQSEAKSIKEVTAEQLNTAKNLLDMIVEFFVKYSFQVLGGVIVIVIGWWVGKYISNLVKNLLDKKKVDVTVTKFIAETVKLLIIAFAVVVALGKFGIEIAPLIAGVSVAGFGLSFALQGPLSN